MRAMQYLGCVLVLMSGVAGCGGTPANEFPEDFRTTYTQQRLFGSNARITVSANSLTMADCTANCPDLVMRFTSISCEPYQGTGGPDRCTVESADCTGTVTEAAMGRSLDVELTAKPGLTGEAAEHRQVNCYQHSGNITQ